MRVELSTEALADVRQLSAWGLSHWGEDAVRTYLDDLDQALGRLEEYPELGVARSDLFPGGRELRCREHRLFYQLSDDVVVIVRILHVRSNTVVFSGLR